MFRQLTKSLSLDTRAPADLRQLGYFVDVNDQVRQIRDPSQPYQYKINRNDRVNEVYKEAMNTCMRAIVLERLIEKGMEVLRVPVGVALEDRHVPILISCDISTKDRVIVLFGDRRNDLGILSYRVMGQETINSGSVVDFVDAILNGASQKSIGLIIANPSQLLWYRGEGRTLTDREWLALPRESAVHEAMRVDEDKNRIPGNRNHTEHVSYLFENVMRGICGQKAKFNIIGLEYTGSAVMQYLTDHWDGWKNQIDAVALIDPQHSFTDLISGGSKPAAVVDFIQQRTRAYLLSNMPPNMIIRGRDHFACNCYSSGETLYEENVFVRCWSLILTWFNEVNANPNYSEPLFEISSWKGEAEGQQ